MYIQSQHRLISVNTTIYKLVKIIFFLQLNTIVNLKEKTILFLLIITFLKAKNFAYSSLPHIYALIKRFNYKLTKF